MWPSDSMCVCVSAEQAPCHSAVYPGYYLVGRTVRHFWVHASISFVCTSERGKGLVCTQNFPNIQLGCR